MPSSNPFVAGARLQDLQKFVGREEELRAIASLMSGDQPTSVNVVGERRIGKSSLLYYFFLTWQQRVLNPSRYVVIYLSLQSAICQREKDFYQAVAAELLDSTTVQKELAISAALSKMPYERLAFSEAVRIAFFEAVREFKKQRLLPVLCLDDFDSLFNHPQEFNNGFYDSLRSMMDDNTIMLVIASRNRLEVHAEEHRFVSGFFNLGHTIKLRELTVDEAIELTGLPINTSEGKKPALNLDEQKYAQQWGKRNPYLLQLAGFYLWEAHHHDKDIKWAKNKFDQQINPFQLGLQRFLTRLFKWLLLIVAVVAVILLFKHPVHWKQALDIILSPINIGNFFENVAHWFIGIIALSLIFFFLTGRLSWKDFLKFVHKLIKKVLPWEEIKDFFNQLFRK